MRHFMLVLFLTLVGPLQAMDLALKDHKNYGSMDDSLCDTGLTVKEAKELIAAQGYKVNFADVICGCLFVAGVFIVFPGIIPGVILAGIGCPQKKSPEKDFDPKDLGLCIAGLTLESITVFAIVVACCTPAFCKGYEIWSNSSIRKICDEIELNQCLDEVIPDEKLIYIENYVLNAPQNFLQKLSKRQVLILAEGNLASIKNLSATNKFSQEVNIFTNAFVQLADMSVPDLQKSLAQPGMKNLIKAQPVLFKFLMNTLPKNAWEDPILVNDYRQIAEAAGSKEIENFLKPFSNSILSDQSAVIIELDGIDEVVEIYNSKSKSFVSKKWLQKVSDNFQGLASEKAIKLLDHYSETPHLLSLLADNKTPPIDANNIYDMAYVASYYHLKDLLKSCDNYVQDHRALNSLTTTWLLQNSRIKHGEYADQYECCCYLGLSVSKEVLLQQMKDELIKLNFPESLLQQMVSFKEESKHVVILWCAADIVNQLKQLTKLKTFIEMAVKYDIQPLRILVKGFCCDSRNRLIESNLSLEDKDKLEKLKKM